MRGLYPKLCNNSITVMSLLFEIMLLKVKTAYNALHKPMAIVSLYRHKAKLEVQKTSLKYSIYLI